MDSRDRGGDRYLLGMGAGGGSRWGGGRNVAGADAEPSPSAKGVEEGLSASREYSLRRQTIPFTWLCKSRERV